MKRLALILAGVAVAGGVAATPAVAGLAGNPSFSHEIPVPVPSTAKTPLFADDHSRDGAPAPASATAEPGDDRGGITPHAEPGDDRGGATTHAEPGDDRGGATPHAEPGDDRGGQSPHAEPGDADSGGGRSGRG
jgi:hypothetical protein